MPAKRAKNKGKPMKYNKLSIFMTGLFFFDLLHGLYAAFRGQDHLTTKRRRQWPINQLQTYQYHNVGQQQAPKNLKPAPVTAEGFAKQMGLKKVISS